MDNNLLKTELNINPTINFGIGAKSKNLPAVEKIEGSGTGYTKVVKGDVTVKPTNGRTTLELSGAGAMHIDGTLTIGG